MASLQITIEIDATPQVGHQHNKRAHEFGETAGAVLDRIVSANAATYPRYKVDPVAVLVATIAAAVAAAEV